MGWIRMLAAVLVGVLICREARGQPVLSPPLGYQQVFQAYFPLGNPYIPGPMFGYVERRISVQVIAPSPAMVVVRPRRPSYDLSGIDLDVESPDRIWGSKAPAEKSEALKAPGAGPKEAARPMPPVEKKPAEANPARPPVPPPPVPPVKKLSPGERWITEGIEAFKDGDYNVALLRFRQAGAADPPGPRAIFLEAQADIVLGRFRHAVDQIEKGLTRRPDWPLGGFRPKLELYGNPDAWTAQRDRLLAAQKLEPKNADYPFLLGYLSWFDGERDVALDYFQQSRALTADPRFSDLFLKGPAAKVK